LYTWVSLKSAMKAPSAMEICGKMKIKKPMEGMLDDEKTTESGAILRCESRYVR